MYSEKTDATKNKATTSQGAHLRFMSKPYAAKRLVMPTKPTCGGNPVKGNRMRKIMPTTPKKAMDASESWSLGFEFGYYLHLYSP